MRRIHERDLHVISDFLRYGDHNPVVTSHPNEWTRQTDWVVGCDKCGAVKLFHVKEEQMTKTDVVDAIIEEFALWKMRWPESCSETIRIRSVEEVMRL